MKIATSNIFQGNYHTSNSSVEHERRQDVLSEKDFKNGVYEAQSYDHQSQLSQYSSNSISHIEQNNLEKTINQQFSVVESSENHFQSTVNVSSWRTPQANEDSDEIEFIRVTDHKIFKSEERLIFESVGEVTTADGRSIDFLMQTDFARQYQRETQGELITTNNQWIDPLVISLTGQVPQVSSGSFEFDLTGDGKNEVMGNLSSGTGYIAFDKNNDGIINDGSELFGATTGAGFAELAQYDDDGNGWIDENDAIFSKLSVWQPQENNENSLLSFSDAQVGAIFLHSSEVEFTFKDDSNNNVGRITQGGTALLENGQATHVFQMEWAQPIEIGNTISWETLANTSFAVVTEAGQINPNTFDPTQPIAAQITNPTGLSSETFTNVSNNIVSQTVFSSLTIETRSRSVSDHAASQSTVNSSTSGSEQEAQETSIGFSEYDESNDEKIIQLRAVIDALKDMRENNQRQQEVLEKKLLIGNNP